MKSATILVLDGHNLLHRARSGFTKGEHAIAFNFFRSMRALVEKFDPARVVIALEGHPAKRYGLLPSYKATRRIGDDEVAKLAARLEFDRQRDEIVGLMRSSFPASIVQHPEWEADDVIANIVERSSTVAQFTIVSSDTDFTQLVCEHRNVQLYDPVRKKFDDWDPDDDYVSFKALKGDPSDNIPGVRGFGKKTAMDWARGSRSNPVKLRKLLSTLDPDARATYERNVELVRFARWSDEDRALMTSSIPVRDWNSVKRTFEAWQFSSITNERSWSKFVGTFDPLFGDRTDEFA